MADNSTVQYSTANISEDIDWCGPRNSTNVLIENSRFYSGSIIYIVAAVGILGNAISLKVLFRPRLNDCFHRLLISLAVFDTIFLLFATVKYVGTLHNLENVFLTVTFPYLSHPFTEIGMAGTIFSTLAITVERYLGICHPMDFPAYRRKPWHYVLPVSIMALGTSMPRFFETSLTLENSTDEATKTITFEYVVVIHKHRYNEEYVFYYLTMFRGLILAIIPFILLIFLNFRIIIDLRRVTVQRFGCQQNLKKEKNLYFVLLSVVSSFIVLHTPRLIIDMYEMINYGKIKDCGYHSFIFPVWFDTLLPVSRAMVILNSSINFLLYCSFGTLFRKECKGMLRIVPDAGSGSTILTNSHRNSGQDQPLVTTFTPCGDLLN